MKKQDLNEAIETLMNSTVEVLSSGKEDIVNLIVDLKDEYARTIIELSKVQERLESIIDEVDTLTIEEKRSRRRLADVSNSFDKYDESDIKKAYEDTNDLRTRLGIKRQEEKMLIDNRTSLELRLKSMLDSIEKGENTIKKLDNVVGYLDESIGNITNTLEDMNKIQMFGIKVIEAQEEERKRISRDIHDGPAQDMANIMLRSEYCEKIIDIDPSKAKEEIRLLKSDVKMTLANIRKIIYDLRPMSLDDLGIIPTMEKYLDEFKVENDINVDLIYSGDFSDIDSAIEVAMYRIVQEALNNIIKHAEAQNINVAIGINKNSSQKREITLKVEDDGVGFSDSEYKESANSKDSGFGLMGMEERVDVLGGKIKIDSRKGIGTTIRAIVPILEKGRES